MNRSYKNRGEFHRCLEQKEKESAEQLEQKDNKIKAVEEQLVRQNDHILESLQETQKSLQVANEKLQQLEAEQRQNVDKSQMLEAQIADVRNQTAMRDKENQRKLQKEEEQIKVLAEQLQQKKREIQNLQQADERLRENLQRNEKETKDKEKQLQELQVKHEQTKQQMVAVEKQLQTQSKELQAKLKENEQQTQLAGQKLEREVQRKLDIQTQAVDTKITDIEKQIQEKTTQIEKRVRDCENYDFPPIIIGNIKIQLMGWWGMLSKHSQDMYTHSGGYKFYLRIYENGQGEGQRTHVSVKLVACKGPFDSSLRWPAKCTMTLQLLNQHRDQDHVTVTKELEWQRPTEGLEVVTFSDKFIAHDDLKWNAEKHTQYLKDDCLHFRIARVWT